jgi:hypothetical protein
MPILEIEGRRVEVGDEFLKMSRADQQATVDEIATSLGPPPPTVPLEGGRAPREAKEAMPSREQMKEAYKEQYRGVSQRMGQAAETANTFGRAISRANPFSDDIQAGINYMRGTQPGDSYQDYLDRQRAMNEVNDERAPITSIGGQIVGGAAAIPATAFGTGVKGAVAGGTALGAAYGAGQGDGLEDRATKAVAGGILGGTIGGSITAGANKIADAMAQRAAARMAAPPPAANRVVEAADELGLPTPRALTTESTALRSGAQTARNIPGAGEAMDDAIEGFRVGLGEKATRVGAMASSGGALKDRATIGSNIRTTVLDKIDDMDSEADGAYKLLRAAINPDKPVDVTAKVSPLLNSIMKMRQAAGETPLGGHLDTVADLMTRPGGVTFNGLQRARSQIGKAINWDARNEGMAVGDLKRLQGSLTAALEEAARLSAKNQSRSSRAVNLLKAADRRYSETAETTSSLARMFDPKNKVADEAIVDKLVRMASAKAGGNIRELRSLKATIGQDNMADVAGYVIDRMGRNNAGEFSGAIFATSLEKMAPAARREIFSDPKIARAVENISELSNAWKRSDVFANKSQTARTSGALGLGAALWADPFTAIAGALGARMFTKIMSTPETAQSLGQWAKTTAKLQGGLEKGTIGSTRAFEKMSRVYAGKIGAEMGVPANDVARALIGSVKSAAEGEQQKRTQ